MSMMNRTCGGLLNALFGKPSVFGTLSTAPDLWAAASSTTPAKDGTGITEPSGGGYARVDLTAANFASATVADPSLIETSALIAFPTASGSWGGAITHIVLFDASTAGNPIAKAAMAASKTIGAGDTLQFASGDLEWTMA